MNKFQKLALAGLIATLGRSQPLSYTITTLAGGSTAFDFAEGKPATSFLITSFSKPAVDRQSNFYFSLGNRVIRVSPDGIATTYAGTGEAGFSGDGGPATVARLTTPGSLLFDPQGRLLIFEPFITGSNRIRRVDANGTISTIAGNGQPPTTSNDGDGGPATSARVHATQGAYDSSGNLFILDSADSLNVRRIGVDNKITTVARRVGVLPLGMASDGTNIYLSDANVAVNRVSRLAGSAFTPITGNQVGFGGDGKPSSGASLSSPAGLAFDSAGNLHIADAGNQRVRTIRNSPPGATVASGQGIISTSAGSGVGGLGEEGAPALRSPLSGPSAITVDAADNIYISDNGSGRFRRFRLNGTFQTIAGLSRTAALGDGGPATQAALLSPGGLFRDTAGKLLITDGGRLRQVTTDGLIDTIAGDGIQGIAGFALLSVVQDSSGNRYVLAGGTLQKIAPDGAISRIIGFADANQDEGPAAKVALGFASSLAVDAQDNIYIGSYKAVRKLTPSGTVTRVAGTNAFVATPLASGDARGAYLLLIGGGLAFDGNGNLFVADTFNHRVLEVTPAGQFTTVAGTYSQAGFSGDGGPAAQALLSRPTGMAFDAWGNLYIMDQGNSRVRKITPDGTISTVAGSATPGYILDSGPAVAGQLSLPFSSGLVSDPAGNLLLVADGRIRKLAGNKLRAEGVLHAAGVTSGRVAAGLRIFIRGTELIPPGAGSDAIRVLFDGQPASFLSIDGSQLITVVPPSVAGQTSTQVEVEIRGARTNALSVPVVAALPGILGIENADGSMNGDASPAASGSTVVLVVTGDGNADPSTLSVWIGGAPAGILDVSPSDAVPGARRVTVQLPDGSADGSSVVFAVGDAASPDGVAIRVQ